jgi:predicted ATPase
MVLCTARPGFRHPWADYTYFHQVAIAPLAAEEISALLRDLLQPYEASPALHTWLRERTGGNPFFVEELVRALQAHGLLTVQNTIYEIAPTARMTLPASIQGLIQARLDRLPAAEKHLLQMAAVIGPEVPFPLLHAGMGGPEDALHRGLAHLQALEFLYETRTVPVPTYTFTHALVQEAAYQALLPSTRQAYHQQIAQVLEEQFAEMVEAQPEVLAQHYTTAGRSAKAIPYWQQAGARAIERSAHVEAMSHLTKGVEVLTSLLDTPERAQQEINIQLALGPVLMATKGYTALEVEKAYARARELCQQIGETPQLFSALQGLYGFYVVRGELQTARELGEQCLTLAQRACNKA